MPPLTRAAPSAPGRTAPAAATRLEAASPAPGRRRGPATEDRALYSCGCGFVFAHEVSTSVACPHCGGTQAW